MLVNKQNDFFIQLFANSVNAAEIKNIIYIKICVFKINKLMVCNIKSKIIKFLFIMYLFIQVKRILENLI